MGRAISNVSHFKIKCIYRYMSTISFDSFLSHVTIPRSLRVGGITSRGSSLICTRRCYENNKKYGYLAPLGIDGLINPFLIEEKRIHLDGYGFKARKNHFYYLSIMAS